MVIRALKAGKHVYSPVPMASRVEECQEIVGLVRQTGLTYMMGETCYYYPCAMFAEKHIKRVSSENLFMAPPNTTTI